MTGEGVVAAEAMGDVWYVSYGSNLSAERFLTYVRGGRPPGVTDGTIQRGARNPIPPAEDLPVDLPLRLYFAGRSARWGGGGVAYLDPNPGSAGAMTWARAYRLGWDQFEDVVAQENGWAETVPIDAAVATAGARLELDGAGSYGLVLNVGERAGAPMLTFTSPVVPPPGRPLVPPAVPYLAQMAAGLVASRDIDLVGVAEHLCAHEQIGARWTPRDLALNLA